MRAIFESEIGAVIRAFAVSNIFGYVLTTLVVCAWIPVFAVSAAMHILATVRARIGSLHLDPIEIDLVATLVAIMVAFLYFWYVHSYLPSNHPRTLSQTGFVYTGCEVNSIPCGE